MKNLTLVITGILLFFSSCKKIESITNDDNQCPAKENIEIVTNSPVVAGWPLTISTMQSMAYMYKWTGPNGFSADYNYFSSEAYRQGKLVTTFADSGIYKVQLRSTEGCIVYEGSVRVQIIDAPTAPCNVANNSSVSSVVGVGGSDYTSVSGSGSGGIYTLDASGGGETMTIRFNGDNEPTPGIYTSSGGYFAMEDEKAGIFISTGLYSFVMHPDFDIYVNKVGGKLQVSFCNCSFSNPLGSTAINISAKVTDN
jgi:hypothetical protein